jgi:hypothetical protein
MMHFVAGDDTLRLIIVVAARVEVPLEPGEVAARDLYAKAMACCKIVARRHGADRELVNLPSFHKNLFFIAFPIADPLDGFIQIEGLSVRIDVHQLDRKVCVLGIRGDIKCYLDGLNAAFSSAFFGL